MIEARQKGRISNLAQAYFSEFRKRDQRQIEIQREFENFIESLTERLFSLVLTKNFIPVLQKLQDFQTDEKIELERFFEFTKNEGNSLVDSRLLRIFGLSEKKNQSTFELFNQFSIGNSRIFLDRGILKSSMELKTTRRSNRISSQKYAFFGFQIHELTKFRYKKRNRF